MPLIFTLFLLIFATACSIEDKPHYLINDSELRDYQGGDRLTYFVLDAGALSDTTGNFNVTLESRDASAPNADETVALLFETQTSQGEITPPFAPQYFSQNEQGELVLEAIASGEDILWLLDDSKPETGEVLYPSDISTLAESYSFSKKLQRCDENKFCLDAGRYRLRSLTLLGKETTSTPYADFEAFKIGIEIDLSIIDTTQAGAQKNTTLSGTQWIYPLLGVVKFVYNTGTSTLIGNLTSTNISIDDSFKSQTQ